MSLRLFYYHYLLHIIYCFITLYIINDGKPFCICLLAVCIFFGENAYLFFSFIFISWRLITLQYCSGFCHTLTWISHGFTCIPHPDPPSHLPHEKMVNITHYQRNANQNHNEVPLHTSQDGCYPKVYKQ